MAAAATQATVILPGSETSLQQVINGLYRSATCPSCSLVTNAPDVDTDQVNPDALWAIGAGGVSAATIVIEIAGNAATNTFGIYDAQNGNMVSLFGGPANQADQALVSITASGQVLTVYLQRDANGNLTGINTWASGAGYFSSNLFGYYLGTGGGTFYSDPTRNAGGADQMVAFRGDGDTIRLPGSQPGVWDSASYILAWEDIAYAASDKDFNDFVVFVSSVNSVPEPVSLALIGAALLALTVVGRRRERKLRAQRND
jgi:hypothetical protein